ncbi:MAG: neuraminidase-like domain-containing protein, partial [Methylococcaceae bacterium]|nr:neuraminidase-like domain-containing protein [Methylococcaceae bacterium]
MKPITAPLNQAQQGEAVANLQQALRALGLEIAPDEFRDTFFGETTVNAVLRFQHSQHIDGRGNVDDDTAVALNRNLRERHLLAPEFHVSGHVVDVVGAPISEQTVVVFDVDLRGIRLIDKIQHFEELLQSQGFQLLGRTRTDADGFYSIGFDREQFIFSDKSHADLLAFVVDDGLLVERSRLASKRDYSNATDVVDLDIGLRDARLLRGVSEWQRLVNAVAPILTSSDISLADIADSEEQIGFLAQETDVDSEQLRTAVQASALAQSHLDRDDAELFYALGRQQTGLRFIELNDIPETELFNRLKNAIGLNIIADKADEQLQDFLARLLKAATIDIINPDNTVPAIQAFNRSLSAANLASDNAKRAVITAAQRFNGDDPKQFWTEHLPQAGLDAAQIEGLKLNNQLYALTDGHLPLIEALQAQRGITSAAELLNFTHQDWLDTLADVGLPEGIENADGFVTELRDTLHAAYPTTKIAQMVQKQEFATIGELQAPLVEFFQRAPSFDFSNSRVEDFADTISDVTAEPSQNSALSDTLKTLQRVFQISPTPEAMTQLLGAGIHSAFQVAGVPEASFVKRFSTILGSEEQARLVHHRAGFVSTRVLDAIITTRELTNLAKPAASGSDKSQTLAAAKQLFPNFETLFGDLSLCECRDCRAVTSPAAYLVDILQFLGKLDRNTEGKSPLDALVKRRPDLPHLRLTCENTNTVIPYIDLVNEVLEYFVAHDQLDAQAIQNNSSETASELRANPQHISLDAYKKLATAVYPFSLPYHQPLDSIRAFLPDNLKRADLMHRFGITGPTVVTEQLRLSAREYAIITKDAGDTTELWEFYGFDGEAAMQLSLPNVPELLNRTGLRYVELVALLKTRFLNPGLLALDFVDDIFKTPIASGQPAPFNSQQVYDLLRDINADLLNPADDPLISQALSRRGITNPDDFIAWTKAHFADINASALLFEQASRCQLASTRLKTVEQIYGAAATPLPSDFLSKLHRFIRLWRRLDWRIEELDSVLVALQANDLSADVLEKLASTKHLAKASALPLENLAALLGNIETHGDKPLYNKLFLTRTIQQLDPTFIANAFGDFLTIDTAISSHRAALLAAFKIKDSELAATAEDAGLNLETELLKLPTLTTLYRYTVLAKALKLSIAELLAIKNLLGLNPFPSEHNDPAAIVAFINAADELMQSEFSINELDYVLTGKGIGLDEAKIQQALVDIRSDWEKLAIAPLQAAELRTLQVNAITTRISLVLGLSEAQTAAILSETLLNNLFNALSSQGFKAEYFNNHTFVDPIATRPDATIDFSGNNSFNVPGLQRDNFGCRWTGQLPVKSNEKRTLVIAVAGTDDSFRLLLDGAELLHKNDGDAQKTWAATVSLEAGRLYHLQLDYTDRSRASGIRLSWKTETSPLEVLPATALITETAASQWDSALRGLHRGAALVQKLPLSILEIQFIQQHRSDFANVDFSDPLLPAWQTLNDFGQLRKLAPHTDWLAVLDAADNPAASVDDLIAQVLSQPTAAWTVRDLQFAISHLTLTAAQLTQPSNWLTVAKLAQFAAVSGFSLQRLSSWAQPLSDFEHLNVVAIDVQNAVRAKYSEKDWADFAPTVTNPLRERRRDALVNYLLVQQPLKDWGVIDADSLFEYFLIDVQMSACMDTSRVRQALSSVQLFVTRCLLNLEAQRPSLGDFWVALDKNEAAQWEWMKLYRVWEANRKVFIYPENWLEPEWRDDRSPFFKDLESELTQNDITTFSVETAFRNYLGKLDSVSNLAVVGVFQDPATNILHVVARSHGIAAQYFYRNRDKDGIWSAWETLPIDVKTAGDGANNGAHILPMIWKGRLFIFWLEFLQKSVPPDPSIAAAKDGGISGIGQLQAKKQWLVHLCFVEFRDSKWQPKQMSKDALRSSKFTENDTNSHAPHRYRAWIEEVNGSLRVGIYDLIQPSETTSNDRQLVSEAEAKIFANSEKIALKKITYSYFELTNPQAEIKVPYSWSGLFGDHPAPSNQFMARTASGKLQLRKSDYLTLGNGQSNYIFNHAVSASTFEAEAAIPFFFRDSKRGFYVESQDRWNPILVIDIIKKPDNFAFLAYANTLQKVQLKSLTESITVKALAASPQEPAALLVSQPQQNLNVASKTASSNSLFAPAKKAAIAFGGDRIFRVPESRPSGFMSKALTFYNFYHPYTESFIEALNLKGVIGLLNQDTDLNSDLGAHFSNEYKPVEWLVSKPYPPVAVEFGEKDAYGLYNWELFFHAPLYIATRLSKNGKYAEAMQWYHHIFNPLTAAAVTSGDYWQVPTFKKEDKETITDYFERLASGDEDIKAKVAKWRENPFKPHLIARGRPVAYKKNVVLKYVENLLTWGDDLFRRDTIESINEATQLYIIAAHILGKRPETIPKRGEAAPETYDSLSKKHLDSFGNAMVAWENLIPYASGVPVSDGAVTAANGSLLGVGTGLYFCIPNNSKLLTYWDAVEDRLFKIRHCLNLDGVERKLALFDPPIDPAMLVAATANGVSLGNVLADLFSPSPLYRFQFLLAKSLELTGEVREMGKFLLSVLEKKDAASLGLLQAGHATSLLKLTEDIRVWHILESKAHRDVLLKA